jgi:hypothetical protein
MSFDVCLWLSSPLNSFPEQESILSQLDNVCLSLSLSDGRSGDRVVFDTELGDMISVTKKTPETLNKPLDHEKY